LQCKFIEADNRGIFCFIVNWLKLIVGGGGGRGLIVVIVVAAVIIIVCTKCI
jgi:hypothetical protein